MTRVGFVGAGRMGGPVVRRLVESGHAVQALGRSDEKRKAVVELGAHAVSDLTAVGHRADVVIVCVFTDEQVRQICLAGELLSAMPGGFIGKDVAVVRKSIAELGGDLGLLDGLVGAGLEA